MLEKMRKEENREVGKGSRERREDIDRVKRKREKGELNEEEDHHHLPLLVV